MRGKRTMGTRQWLNVQDGGQIQLNDRGQVRLAMALILRQAECDVVHYRRQGYIRGGRVLERHDGKRHRLNGCEPIDPDDVKATVEGFRSGYFQWWANALQLGHKIDTARLIGAGMGTESGRKRTQLEA